MPKMLRYWTMNEKKAAIRIWKGLAPWNGLFFANAANNHRFFGVVK